MCGRDAATASYWLFGLLLTEGGAGEEQAAIVLGNDWRGGLFTFL